MECSPAKLETLQCGSGVTSWSLSSEIANSKSIISVSEAYQIHQTPFGGTFGESSQEIGLRLHRKCEEPFAKLARR